MQNNKNTLLKYSKYYKLLDHLFLKIEDNLNLYSNDVEIDYEIQNYVITITFINKSLIIINKQELLRQVWLATSKNGYHFNYKDHQWICNRTKRNFWDVFQHACSIQSKKTIVFLKQ